MNNKNKIKINLNGKLMSINPNFPLKALLEKLKIPTNKIAIELNHEIINKNRINKISLKQNDKIEIVHFIGGG
tara:strand:- start:19 stop:237 length:219 start_codon:yes stop_codon:yes gene_type:complete